MSYIVILMTFTAISPSIGYGLYNVLKKALIIHEENTKKNHKRVVSVYVIRLTVVYETKRNETKRNEICSLRNLQFAKSVICEICSLRNL